MEGRTARQDRPGQFYVILDSTQKPFNDPKHKKLAGKLRKLNESGSSRNLLEDGRANEDADEQLPTLQMRALANSRISKASRSAAKSNELTEKSFATPAALTTYGQSVSSLRPTASCAR